MKHLKLTLETDIKDFKWKSLVVGNLKKSLFLSVLCLFNSTQKLQSKVTNAVQTIDYSSFLIDLLLSFFFYLDRKCQENNRDNGLTV